MQVIDADWQSKIELHIVTMRSAMDHATSVPPGDEHAKRWHSYVGTCHAFLDHVCTHFNSVPEFDDFLKSQTREAMRCAGYDDIPKGWWRDIKDEPALSLDMEAQNLAAHYTHVFEPLMHHATTKVKHAASNTTIHQKHLNYNAS